MLLKANKDRIYDNLNTLSTFNSCPEQEGITRALFSEAEIGARSYVKELMTQAGPVSYTHLDVYKRQSLFYHRLHEKSIFNKLLRLCQRLHSGISS